MSDSTRRLALRALQVAFVVVVFIYGGQKITNAWSDARLHGGADIFGHLRWSYIAAATGIVLLTYVLLIQLWRYILSSWGDRLGMVDAMAIWSISGLGRYVPGRVWQIAAMMALSRRRGVSPASATASSLLNTLLNIVAGILVALALGGRTLDRIRPGAAFFAAVTVALAVVGIVVLPWLLPTMVRFAAPLLRREVAEPRMSAGAIWLTAGGNVLAWALYGVAFQLFTAGVFGDTAAGATTAYIAVYTGSYVVGYLAFFTPGGLGAREAAMVATMVAFGLTTEPQAWLLAFASRLWLLIVEVLPGVLFLAHSFLRQSTKFTSGDASP